jgi:hypothetical protein
MVNAAIFEHAHVMLSANVVTRRLSTHSQINGHNSVVAGERRGVRGSAVDWGTVLKAGRSRTRFPIVSLVFFYWLNPSDRTEFLRPAQPLQKLVPGIFVRGKGGQCVGLTNFPHSYADCLEIWRSQTPGALRSRPGFAFNYLQCSIRNKIINKP